MSLANNPCVYTILDSNTEIPFQSCLSLVAKIDLLRPSNIMIKRKGDKGSPCLIPREEEKKPQGELLINTKNLAVDTQEWVHLIHLVQKPNFLKTAKRKSQFTLWYAFIISNFNNMVGIFWVLMECRTSCAIIAPSDVSHPGTNPPYSSNIIKGINLANLPDMALVKIL